MDRVRLKWPNDVLVDGKKLAGVLIEPADGVEAIVIGVGMNIAEAPCTELDHGREAAALVNAFPHLNQKISTLSEAVAEHLCRSLVGALESPWKRCDVVKSFSLAMAMDLVMYKRKEGGRGERVVPKRLNEWGHLVVKNESGAEEVLCAEYLL